MPKVTVLVGLPGSGKSTFLNFANEPEFSDTVFVYSTDNYIEKIASANNKTYNEAFKDNIEPATKAMNAYLEIALSMKVDVYWDQTNMSPKKRKGMILSKFPKSYVKECYCIAPPQNDSEYDELTARLSAREIIEGKTIPMHIIQSMADSYVEPELDEGFDYIKIVDLFGNTIAEKGVKDE